ILQPPGNETNAAFSPVVVTPTQSLAQSSGGGIQTPLSLQTPGATPPANKTPSASGATGPSGATGATGATGAGGTYTVQTGDSLTAICEKVKPATMTNGACVDQIVSLNSLSNAGSISAGQTLKVPQ
ncbi:MAG TPA: LysM domain-containing protein, partial [Dehalococcoidia bacterium]|nr:LysM domain-containing protein [Dehalococcoidia bacterium]